MKRIGLLTAGGDAPGQNVCLKRIIFYAIDHGYEVVGFRKGWEGLLDIDLNNPVSQAEHAMILSKARVRDIDRSAGSFLHSSRLDPGQVPAQKTPAHLKPLSPTNQPLDLTEHIRRVVENLDLEALIVLGDSYSLRYAAHLFSLGVPIIGIPMTVHNDINGSQYSLGFSTALATGVRFVNEIRAMAGSREEIAVVEMFGRENGLTTLLIGALSGADRVLIPEVPFDPENLAELLKQDQQVNPNNYAIMTMSESVSILPEKSAQYSPDLHRRAAGRSAKEGELVSEGSYTIAGERDIGLGAAGGGAVVTEILEKILGQRLVFQPLTYVLRVGYPDGQDLLGAMNFATLAIELLISGKMGRLVAYRRGENYIDLPIEIVTQSDDNLDVNQFYDTALYQPKPTILWASRI